MKEGEEEEEEEEVDSRSTSEDFCVSSLFVWFCLFLGAGFKFRIHGCTMVCIYFSSRSGVSLVSSLGPLFSDTAA